MKAEILKKSLKKNLEWFMNSGVMDPKDGSWGVAERIAVTKGNEAIEKMFEAFPAYVNYKDYAVIEQRRPDCNFEAALLLFLSWKIFGDDKYLKIAENILKYLYFRSGMRNHKAKFQYPAETWKWSNIQWVNSVYFDDNAWNCVIPLILAKLHPEFEKMFGMKESALTLAGEMEKGFHAQFDEELKKDAKLVWAGHLRSPHWGSLAVMTFAYAYTETKEAKYKKTIAKYEKYLIENKDTFTTSEQAYAVIGEASAYAFTGSKKSLETANIFSEMMLSKMDRKTGNIPSEWGKEAPTGENLVDLIYTQNWALLALHMLKNVSDDKKIQEAFEKVFSLVVKIQDKSSEKQFKGCWRGMYDLKKDEWGGGDRYEGGAGSIYTGWTNAPISIIIALELLKDSLVSKN